MDTCLLYSCGCRPAGQKVYECSSCGSTRTEYEPALPAPVEEQNGRNAYAALTVEGAAYEMHQESTRCIVTADSDTATLFGCLGNLAELKAQGVDTLVFRTKSRETGAGHRYHAVAGRGGHPLHPHPQRQLCHPHRGRRRPQRTDPLNNQPPRRRVSASLRFVRKAPGTFRIVPGAFLVIEMTLSFA